MNKIIHKFLANLKIYLKLWFSFKTIIGVLLGVTLIFLSVFGYFVVFSKNSYDVLGFLSRINFFYCFLMMSCVFVVINGLYYNHSEEVVTGIDKGKNSYQKNIFIIALIYNFIMQVILISVFIAFALWRGEYYFISHFFEPYVFNIYLPQLICLLIVYTTSRFKNKAISLLIVIGFVLFASPFAESIYFATKPSFPIDKIYDYMRLPFTLFYQNGDWALDIQYGLQCDSQRLFSFIFWIVLSGLAHFVFNIRNQFVSHKKNKIISIGLVIILGLTTVLLYFPEGKYRVNFNWDGNMKDYNENIYKEIVKIPLKNIDYAFTDYDFNIRIQRVLNVDGTMQLISNNPNKDFVFTLYQDYKIKALEATDLKTYKQIGNNVYLEFNKPITNTEVKIEYSGYHPKFYSTHEGVMLPGFFAWYPMAGEKVLFYNAGAGKGSGYKYNLSNSVQETNITLHTDREYITNLDNVEDCVYQGKTTNVSLFDGYMEPTKDPLIINYLPFDYSNHLEDSIKEKKREIQESIDIVKDKYHLDMSYILKKKIILVSKDFYRNFFGNEIAIMDDSVIAYDFNERFLFSSYFNNSPKLTLLLQAVSKSYGENLEELYQNILTYIEAEEDANANKVITLLKSVHEDKGVEKLFESIYKYSYDMSIDDDIQFLERINSYD